MMKKYLMTGLAAVALCAAMTSCSSNDELYNPEQQRANDAAQIQENYNKAFIEVFGQPAADQDWGFGAAAGTRTAVNVNGNLWEEMPSVSPEEKLKVFNYVNMTRPEMKAAGHKYTEVFPENLVNYWVSQVWTGTDTYTNYDGATGVGGSAHMDHLQIADSDAGKISEYGDLSETGWYHVNNFNRGDNTDWSGNTLIENSGTKDFAYNCSEDANYHNKWIAVNGADIDASLKGYYYICFDFIAVPDGCYTVFEVPALNNAKVNVPGAFNSVDDLLKSGLVSVNEEGQTTITVSEYDWETQGNKPVTYVVESNWRADQVVSGNQFIDANDVYTDWIIRLVKAEPADEEEKKDDPDPDPNVVRIIAEDLTISNDPSGKETDFDFNDVVFDVTFNEDGSANVQLVAAGGTLPLTVGGVEVHEKFGYPERNANGYYKMINTGSDVNGATAESFRVSNPGTKGKDIKIMVNKFKKNADGTFTDNWIELTAQQGVPAAKLCVNQTFEYCSERQSIKKKYPNFSNWVLNKDYKWW